MAENIRENVKSRFAWLRLLFILLFALVFYLTTLVLGAVVLIQWGFVLLTGRANDNLLRFGRSLARFLDEIVRYATFNTDDRPFPFSEWPEPDPSAASAGAARSGGSRAGKGSSGTARRGGGSSRSGTAARASSARRGRSSGGDAGGGQ